AATRRLDHQDRLRMSRDQAIAARKVGPPGRRAERELGDDRTAGRDALGKAAVACRIHLVEAGADEGDGGAARLEGAGVRGGVDAEGEAAGDRPAPNREPLRELAGTLGAAGARVA